MLRPLCGRGGGPARAGGSPETSRPPSARRPGASPPWCFPVADWPWPPPLSRREAVSGDHLAGAPRPAPWAGCGRRRASVLWAGSPPSPTPECAWGPGLRVPAVTATVACSRRAAFSDMCTSTTRFCRGHPGRPRARPARGRPQPGGRRVLWAGSADGGRVVFLWPGSRAWEVWPRG